MRDYFAANDIAGFNVMSGSPSEGGSAGTDYDSAYTPHAITLGSTTTQIRSAPFTDPDTGTATALTDFWLHFEYRSSNTSPGANGCMQIVNSAGTPVLRLFETSSATQWRVDYWDGSAWVTTGPNTGSWPGNTTSRNTFDLHIVCGASGSVTLYGNGSGPYLTLSGLNAAVTNGLYVDFYGCAVSSVSQVLVSDTTTVGAKVASRVLNANATYTSWTGDYTSITKVGINDATLISDSTTGDKESYGATSITVPSGFSISSLFFAVRGKLSTTTPVNFLPLLRIGGADYDTTYNFGNLNSASFAASVAGFSLDPSTSAAWTATNVNSAELGFKSAA